MAGTIGASELQSRAGSLEAAIKKGEEWVESHLEKVGQELTRLVASISEVMGLDGKGSKGEEAEDGPEVSAEVKERLPELAKKLEEKLEVCEELSATLDMGGIEGLARDVKYLGEELRVDSIDQQCQDDAEPWERKPLGRLYYLVTLEDGQRLTVFKNMEHGGWYTLTA